MAAREWVARVVNTEGCRCPLTLQACPGTRKGPAGCAFWLEETLTNAETRDTDVQGGCLLVWQYVIQHEVVLESVRTQAGIDKAATQVHGAAGALQMALYGPRRHQDALSGERVAGGLAPSPQDAYRAKWEGPQ